MKVIIQAFIVSPDTIIIPVSPQLLIQFRKQHGFWHAAIFLAPCLKVDQGCPLFLAIGSPFQNGCAVSVPPLIKFKAQEGKSRFCAPVEGISLVLSSVTSFKKLSQNRDSTPLFFELKKLNILPNRAYLYEVYKPIF